MPADLVTMEKVPRRHQHLDAGAREAELALDGLVGVGRRPDHQSRGLEAQLARACAVARPR